MGKKGGSLHLKREASPAFWPIHRKEFTWAVKPRPGPHSINRCIPLVLIVREILGLAKTRKEAKKIKYLFMVGDNVDGVGIFPGQESQINIKDIREQYAKLAELLSKIRKDVKIIMCPGQHDAVRVAEPQPAIPEKYAPKLHELENVFLVSNPAIVSISDSFKELKVLMYHGVSMNSIINETDSLRLGNAYDNPSIVVKKMLERRHLSGQHSSMGITYIPTKQDYLLIREVPDIVTTADLHVADIGAYNNILIITNSCWQSRTAFEEKVGHHPNPCKVPVFNLKTREIKIMDFS